MRRFSMKSLNEVDIWSEDPQVFQFSEAAKISAYPIEDSEVSDAMKPGSFNLSGRKPEAIPAGVYYKYASDYNPAGEDIFELVQRIADGSLYLIPARQIWVGSPGQVRVETTPRG